jgi:hypothetical protein
MVTSHTAIVLPPDLIERCMDFGRRVVASYAAGENPNSLAVSSHGAEKNPWLQGRSKCAEAAFAIYAGQSIEALRWETGRPDHGSDLAIGGALIDVKKVENYARWLIWPYNKVDHFASKRFTTLVAVRDWHEHFVVERWIDKRTFFRMKEIAPAGHKLDAGTWFVPIDDCSHMNTFAGHIAELNRYNARDDFSKSIDACYAAIRGRIKSGGVGWSGN